MIHVLVVEDSFDDVQVYKKILQTPENVDIIYACSGEEALQLLQKTPVDIFFLDVDLPGMDGFQLAREIRNIPDYYFSYIIFITGYSENQLDAFKELHCYDYLVKPFSIEEFKTKMMTFIENVAIQANDLEKKSDKTKMILFSTSNGDYLVDTDDIVFAETYRNNCFLHTEQGVYRLVGVTLKEVIDQVGEDYFVRCHKSFAVNIKKIAFIRQVNYRLRQISFKCDDKIVDLSNMFYDSIIEKYQKLSANREA